MSQKIKTSVEIDGSLSASQIQNATVDTDKFLVSDGGTVKYRTGAEMLSDLGVVAGTANHVQHPVKAGVAINKGQAVYVTGADGTNMIVGLASNSSEATSSKTMGLLNATVVINGFADVITEGLLSGLNTSTATVGDPVWLGTSGNLIYGLANKPYAPAHLVFIGIVTRVNANNGEIFVKVQNGFELDELHDVDLKTTTPINGHLLGFNGTLWVNKTIAGWLGYTPQNAATAITTSNIGSQSVNYANSAAVATNADYANSAGYAGNAGTLDGYDSSYFYPASNPNGYISSYTETDPTVPSYVKSITSTEKSNWNTAYGWGNHALAGYVPQSRTITINGVGYDLSANRSWTISATAVETDTLATVTARGAITTGDIYTPNNGGIFFNGNGVYGSGVFGRNAGQDLGINAGGLERIRVLSDGKVAVGTSSSGEKFNITDGSGTSLLRLNQTAATWSSTMVYGTTTATTGGFDFIGMYANGSAKFNVGSTGIASASSDFRAPVFYDSNDTTYYSDLASTAQNATRQRGGTIYGPNTTWGAYLLVGGNGRTSYIDNALTASVCATDGNIHLDAGSGKTMYFNWYDGGAIIFGNGAESQVGYMSSAGDLTVNSSSRAPIFYDSNNTGYYLDPASTSNMNAISAGGYIFSGNYIESAGAVYGTIFYDNNDRSYYCDPNSTSRLYQVNAPQGYISNGNPWGTANSAYFPNGITTAGSDNWIYGHTYVGNAPANGAGHEFWSTGKEYHRSSEATNGHGASGRWLSIQSANGSFIPYSFESEYGNHSWGIVARFRINQSGADRPSIQFSSASSDTRWNIGYCYADDNFRIVQNMGYRNDNSTSDGWGTQRLILDTAGNFYSDGLYQSNSSLRAPIFYDSQNTGYYCDPSGTSRMVTVNADELRSYNDIYIDADYGHTIVGTYSSYRFQGVFAMGNSWKLPVSGTSCGDHYGIAWSHPNAGGQAANLTDHGILIQTQGVTRTAISNTIWCIGDIIAYSDAKVKDNVKVIDNPLERIKKVRGVTFTRNDFEDKEKRYAGVIAQEMRDALSEVVSENSEGNLSVSYGNSISLLIECIKEQQKQIEELKQSVNQLINK